MGHEGATTMLLDAIPGLSDRMLSERLKELEAQGIVQRTVVPTTPVTIVYRLTEKGAALRPVLDAVGTWAHEWLPANPVEDETNARDGVTAA